MRTPESFECGAGLRSGSFRIHDSRQLTCTQCKSNQSVILNTKIAEARAYYTYWKFLCDYKAQTD